MIQKIIARLIRNKLNRSIKNKKLDAKTKEMIISTSYKDTRILLYYPEKKAKNIKYPVFINLHGGGFVSGTAEIDDEYCKKIANKTDCVVISIDYVKAPEDKYPNALHEIYYAVKWIYENDKELNINNEKIAIGGNSAGGNLAASVCHLAKDKKEFKIIYQVINYAPLDLSISPFKKISPSGKHLISPILAKIFNELYVKKKYELKYPLVSPLLSVDFKNLPPALIITCEYDSLADEGKNYSLKLANSKVRVKHKRFLKCEHAFIHKKCKEADEALDLIFSTLKTEFDNN